MSDDGDEGGKTRRRSPRGNRARSRPVPAGGAIRPRCSSTAEARACFPMSY